MCESISIPRVLQVKDGFDRSNPAHFYVGRWKKHYKPGQPFLGNPFRIPRDGNRQDVIGLYKIHLWARMQEDGTLRQWLRNLPDNAILFCHCHPLPCHAAVILAASKWLKQQDEKWGEEPSAPAEEPPHAGDYLIPFGAHQGKSLREVFEERPSYLDWLGSQTWTRGKLARAVTSFLSQPDVRREIDRRYFDEDPMTGRPFTTYEAFLPSLKTSKKFSQGRPTWIKIEYGQIPLSKLKKEPEPEPSQMPVTDVGAWVWAVLAYGITIPRKQPLNDRRWRWEGPQEPKRDIEYDHKGNAVPQRLPDADPRPKNMVTVSPSRYIDSLKKMKRVASYNEDQAALSIEPTPRQIATRTEAWDVAADLMIAIESAECVEDIDLIERDARIEQLENFFPPVKTCQGKEDPNPVLFKLRQAWITKRDRFALIALLPDWQRNDALLALEAIEEARQERTALTWQGATLAAVEVMDANEVSHHIRVTPDLEPILKEQAPELHDAVELLRLS